MTVSQQLVDDSEHVYIHIGQFAVSLTATLHCSLLLISWIIRQRGNLRNKALTTDHHTCTTAPCARSLDACRRSHLAARLGRQLQLVLACRDDFTQRNSILTVQQTDEASQVSVGRLLFTLS